MNVSEQMKIVFFEHLRGKNFEQRIRREILTNKYMTLLFMNVGLHISMVSFAEKENLISSNDEFSFSFISNSLYLEII